MKPRPDRATLLWMYETMVRIRRFEEEVNLLFLSGNMPGTIHLYMGEEAIAAGVCAHLSREDVITSTHRPHGHAIAKGIPTRALMAELFGKTTGCCKGYGGSMHVGDISVGALPAIAIVGGGAPIAAGCALAFKYRREPRVARGLRDREQLLRRLDARASCDAAGASVGAKLRLRHAGGDRGRQRPPRRV